jgi:hypothetical protein
LDYGDFTMLRIKDAEPQGNDDRVLHQANSAASESKADTADLRWDR